MKTKACWLLTRKVTPNLDVLSVECLWHRIFVECLWYGIL